jgi:hypothetical protein
MSEFSRPSDPASTASDPPAYNPIPTGPAAAGPPPPPPPAPVRQLGLPRWLPLFLLAVVPAVIVGLVVFAVSGNSGSSGASAAGAIDGFVRLGGSTGDIESFKKQTPPGWPKDLPAYPGSTLVVSFLIRSDQGNSYFVIYQTGDNPDAVLKYFQDKLDKDPWQVEVAQSSTDFTGVRFSRPDNADVQGDLSVNHSDLDNRTTIYFSYQDLKPSSQAAPTPKPFKLPVSKDLPPGFPADVPIFAGKSPSTVTGTYLQRGGGGTNYLVTFLTKEQQDDVIAYYKSEFGKKGWTVTDSKSKSSGFELAIDFQDGPRQLLQGSIHADTFQDDASYTEVSLLLQVSSSRGRGN